MISFDCVFVFRFMKGNYSVITQTQLLYSHSDTFIDHGHSDGLATKSDTGETQYVTVNTFKEDDMPSYSVTTRSGSPMGPIVGTPIIRRGSGVSSSLTNRSSNSSSAAGYVDGDKFIRTDEDGNQIALKMVKADHSATTTASSTTTTTSSSKR